VIALLSAFLLVPLASADSDLLAPGGMVLTAAGLLALAANTFKQGRNIDVESERTKRVTAEAEAKAVMAPLMERISALEGEVHQLRTLNERKLLEEHGKNYQLRKLLRDNGITYPEELGPA
jgi:hypothetical protein